MGLLVKLLSAAGGFVTAVMNSITDVFLTPPLEATLEHLEEADLKTLSGGESTHQTVFMFAALVTPFTPNWHRHEDL